MMTHHNNNEFGPIREDEFEQIVHVLSQALFEPPDSLRPWLTDIGVPYLRALRKNGIPVASLGILPMSQWFGGKNVPIWGITAVGVAPEYRGTGVGVTLLRRALEEQYEQGIPLAALYPATVTFYRRNGYEYAATRTIYELSTEAISVRDRTLDVVPVTQADYETVRSIYAQRAQISSGNLDRHVFFWNRLFEPKDKITHKYMVMRDSQPEGYIIFSQNGRSDPLNIHDLCVLTREAGLRILTLLADHRSMVERVTWSGAPFDALNFLITEPRHKVQLEIDLMLRIVDVQGALAARGYPPGVDAELHFDIQDDVLPWNNGRFVLHVADGRAQVQPGGTGRIRLDVRALASLYSSYYTPLELRMISTLDAPEADLAMAGLVFAGPRPWIPDMF